MTKVLINIDVPDLAKAIMFYTRAFELKVARQFGQGGVELLGAEAPIYLLVKGSGTKPHEHAKRTRDYHRHWTPVHVDFAVYDIDKAVARVTAAGAITESEIKEQPYGKIAMFSDPWGNGFCLIEFSERGYDAIATRKP